jgi:hypothetical protein
LKHPVDSKIQTPHLLLPPKWCVHMNHSCYNTHGTDALFFRGADSTRNCPTGFLADQGLHWSPVACDFYLQSHDKPFRFFKGALNFRINIMAINRLRALFKKINKASKFPQDVRRFVTNKLQLHACPGNLWKRQNYALIWRKTRT